MHLRKSKFVALIALGLCAVGATAATQADATTTKTSCTLNFVVYDNGRLIVQCSGDGNLYYAFLTGAQQTGCASQTADTLKIWSSLFEGGLLSGKFVEFNFDPAAGSCTIPVMTGGVKLRAQ